MKFILVDEYQGIAFTPLNVQINTSPREEPADVNTNVCQLNTDHVLPSPDNDEYRVINSEDEVDDDTFPVNDQDEDDNTSGHLIRAFSPTNDSAIQEKIIQLSQEQDLSPKGSNQAKKQADHFTKKYLATSVRHNTRLYTSRSS